MTRIGYSVQKAAFAGSAALLVVLSGCVGPLGGGVKEIVDAVDLPDVSKIIKLLDDGGFSVQQPVEVYLVGFEPGMGELLQKRMKPEEVNGAALDFVRGFPTPDPQYPVALLDSPIDPLPTVPTAVYTVRQMDAAFSEAFFRFVATKQVFGPPSTYDANAAEDYLARELAAAGVTIDPKRPAFVILHGGALLAAQHTWRYTYSHGYLQGIRAFGEKVPLTIYDASGIPDEFVVSKDYRRDRIPDAVDERLDQPNGLKVRDYNYVQEPAGEKTLKNLEELVIDATHYRVLQPAIYPVSTKPCHHITLVFAVHQTALTEVLPGFTKADQWVDVAGLKSAWENLTEDEVYVDLKKLMLPKDDPALDALMRGSGFVVTLDALRWYLDTNWQKFVTLKSPCEEYLSLLIFGDAAQRGAFGGVGMYDFKSDRRISFSLWSEDSRVRREYQGPAEDRISTRTPSEITNRVNLLYSHETGHLFGQHHPQHLQHAKGPSPSVDTFQSVYSVMSYQTGERLIDFGKIDTANWQRNRVGYTVEQVRGAKMDKTPEFDQALLKLAMFQWDEAHALLEPHAQHAMKKGMQEGADFHIGDNHEHPWT